MGTPEEDAGSHLEPGRYEQRFGAYARGGIVGVMKSR